MNKKAEIIVITVLLLLCIIIFKLPTGFEKEEFGKYERVKAKIIEVDNSEVLKFGIVTSGTQVLDVKILNGNYKGEIIKGENQLLGKLEFDKIFNKGDIAFVVLNITNDKINFLNVVDHYRINTELILFVVFILILILVAGTTGLKALLSFVFTGLVIWKILIPGFLKGYDPVIFSIIIISLLTAVIIFLVGGFNKKGSVAFLGAISGIVITSLLSISFGALFKVHGAIKPFTESLLYTGFANLDLNKIFFSGIFLASSGAVMDVAMDISASLYELKEKNPKISFKELLISGFNIGKSVIGTMTTTLLLAYSGGYMSLLMVFMAQGTPAKNILNLNYVSAEILHTMVGSFGLVLVAPLTAIIGSFIYSENNIKINLNFKEILINVYIKIKRIKKINLKY